MAFTEPLYLETYAIAFHELLFYKDATSDSNWVAMMQQKMDSIFANKTWSLVDLLSKYKVIAVKWIYKFKSRNPPTRPKFKAQLVAKGDQQHMGFNFQETFLPMVKWTTMKIVIYMAAMKGWQLLHLDVKTAFLNGNIIDTVFLKHPPGFILREQEHLVCHLHKAIYRLRQSSHAWHE